MRKAREPPKGGKMHVASCSFGKDSIATVILAHENNEPLNEIIYSEVMFDKNISAELPEHRDFIYNVAIPNFERMGYKVNVLRAKETYVDRFFRIKQKGDRAGQIYGFPPVMKCWANNLLKMRPIREHWKKQTNEVVQYVGIAIDEQERLDRIVETKNKLSLLQKYNFTEQQALALCKERILLSPIYDFTFRGGCWFCQNQSLLQLKELRKRHPELWKRLLELQEYSPHPLRIDCPMQVLENRFYWEDQQMTIFDFIEEENDCSQKKE